MFISKFSVENWVGNQNKGFLKQAHFWAEIETAIKELDGHRKTLVTLEAEDETHMAIGGGIGKYVVYLTFNNEDFHYLVDLSKSDEEMILVVGDKKIFIQPSCVLT